MSRARERATAGRAFTYSTCARRRGRGRGRGEAGPSPRYATLRPSLLDCDASLAQSMQTPGGEGRRGGEQVGDGRRLVQALPAEWPNSERLPGGGCGARAGVLATGRRSLLGKDANHLAPFPVFLPNPPPRLRSEWMIPLETGPALRRCSQLGLGKREEDVELPALGSCSCSSESKAQTKLTP